MRKRIALALVTATAASMLPACKPPPSDAAVARAANLPAAVGPSDPLASPDVQGALWAVSGGPDRIVYGIPGQPVLVSLECLPGETGGKAPSLRMTRHAPADAGSGALLALIGNGYIGRLEVDATPNEGRSQWQGRAEALDRVWEPLTGPREATVTVPGAGLVRLNPDPLPMQLVERCRERARPADRG